MPNCPFLEHRRTSGEHELISAISVERQVVEGSGTVYRLRNKFRIGRRATQQSKEGFMPPHLCKPHVLLSKSLAGCALAHSRVCRSPGRQATLTPMSTSAWTPHAPWHATKAPRGVIQAWGRAVAERIGRHQHAASARHEAAPAIVDPGQPLELRPGVLLSMHPMVGRAPAVGSAWRGRPHRKRRPSGSCWWRQDSRGHSTSWC